MLPNGIAAAGVLLGAMHGGYVVSPVSLLAQDALIEHTLAHSRTRIVFAAPEFVARLEAIVARSGSRAIVRETSPDDPAIARRRAARVAHRDPQPEAPAMLMYTSGTTGRPKGALLSHANLVHAGRAVGAAHALTPDDRVLSSLPLYHVNGQCIATISPLVVGRQRRDAAPLQRVAVVGLVERYRPTWLNVVPTIIAYLLNGADLTPGAGRRVPRRCASRARRRRRCRPSSIARSRRASAFRCWRRWGSPSAHRSRSRTRSIRARASSDRPGVPLGMEARVVAADGTVLGDGAPGEIELRGANVMLRYHDDPEATARTLREGGWLATGDLGYRDADGFYFVTGRLKELIIKGGENIAPREIDEALLEHPAVLEAAAVGIPDPEYGQEILACVVLKPGVALHRGRAARALRRRARPLQDAEELPVRRPSCRRVRRARCSA